MKSGPGWVAFWQARDQIVKGGRSEAVNLMLWASERGQRKARSRSRKGGMERGETLARELDCLGSHDIHRAEAEGC